MKKNTGSHASTGLKVKTGLRAGGIETSPGRRP